MPQPQTFTSRTFLRNFKPPFYPAGASPAYNWTIEGGLWDNTDPKNPMFWGPPRPINGDAVFGLEPGEMPAKAVERLKRAGYIGLYSHKAQTIAVRDADGDADASDPEYEPLIQNPRGLPPPQTALERIAAVAAQSRTRRGLSVSSVAEDEGRRPTRTEERGYTRRQTYTETLAGVPLAMPSLTAQAEAEESAAELLDAELDGDGDASEQDLIDGFDEAIGSDAATAEEFADALQRDTERRTAQALPGDFVPVRLIEPAAPVQIVAEPQPAPVAAPDASDAEEDDAPVGGGGKAAERQADAEPPAETSSEPPVPAAPPKPAPPVQPKPTARPSLAGGGRRAAPARNTKK